MKVRRAISDDIDSLARLFDGYRIFYRKESDIEGGKVFLLERMSNRESEIFICENESGEMMGFTQLYPLFTSTRMKKAWLLNDLFVSPDHRGKGVSVQLIERAKQLVRDTNAYGMFLETEKSNEIGNKLYPRTGFVLNDGSNYYEWTVD